MSFATVKHISEGFIKPKHEVYESKCPYNLAPWDLAMLSAHYIQKGLLFTKPSHLNHLEYSIDELCESLKGSLSLALVHFYPLAGQLETTVDEDRHESLIYIDCNKGPGARFIRAALDMTIFDILSPTNVPEVVKSFFDHDRAVNHDGHTRPLLSVQVTELLDGFFIGCSANHVVLDGTSYWHFWKVWSEIHRANGKQVSLSCPTVHNRWFPDGYGPAVPLPFTRPEEFVSRYEAPPLIERIFHFSSESIASLKANANEESKTGKISSFQALSALVWRSIIRANRVPHNQVTTCFLVINNRHRLNPPLPQGYFGNSLKATKATITAGELLDNSSGQAALVLHQSVVNHTDKALRDFLKEWLQSPVLYQFGTSPDPGMVLIGSSPRFDMYGNEFGLGKAVAVCSGYANKSSGKVSSYPGREGEGSVDLEICLSPDSMRALESDKEFMEAASLPYKGY